MGKINDFIDSCDQLIRSGEINRVRRKLKKFSYNSLTQKQMQKLAALYRRVGLVQHGLRLLTPDEFLDREHWLKTSPSYLVAEYGILIQRSGSIDESLQILLNIKDKEAPEALLYRAFCYFATWEENKAVESLEKYLQFDLPSYQALIGQVNLASAYIGVKKFNKAKKLIEVCLKESEKSNYHRLMANILEIKGRMHLLQNELPLVKESVHRANSILKNQLSTDSFLIKKVEGILKARERGTPSAFQSLRKEALERQDWESVRDIDFQSLHIKPSQSIFDSLYFGTPYSSYRKRLVSEFDLSTNNEFLIIGHKKGKIFDLESGTSNGEDITKPGGTVHRTLAILLMDFYRPVPQVDLFKKLNPDEYFDIFTSPSRVQQAIRHTRKFLKKYSPKTQIQEIKGAYKIVLGDDIAFKIPREMKTPNWFEIQLKKINSKSKKKFFKTKELQVALGLSPSPFWRFINWAIEEGHISKSGSGPSTAYSFK